MQIALLLANGFEESEALITYDILKRANIKCDLLNTTDHDIVVSSHNVSFSINKYLKNDTYKEYDGFILPGGIPGVPNLNNNPTVIENILNAYKLNKYLFAICAAPSIFSNLNILDKLNYTCYPGFKGNSGNCTNSNIEITKQFITAKAMGQTTNFALAIVEKLISKDAALKVKKDIYYD